MNKKLIIFDLDGTLVETSESIINSFKYVEKVLNLNKLVKYINREFMGLPLKQIYKEYYCLSDDYAEKAINLYRNRYNSKFKKEVFLYEKVIETLKYLKNNNYKLVVCTLKRQDLAINLLKYLNIYSFFDEIYGIDKNDTLSKEDLISNCLKKYSDIKKNEIVLIGDSISDINAAKFIGIEIIIATYGHGMLKIKDKNQNISFFEIKSFNELKKVL